jgi:protein gp37
VGDNSAIGWTDATWNPIFAISKKTGKRGWFCVHNSDGCRNCYADRMNLWRGNGLEYVAKNLSEVEIKLNTNGTSQSSLSWPLRARRPRKIFVCSMTDLFARFVPDEFIDMIFAVMALTPHHIFQVLTKEPARMLGYLTKLRETGRLAEAALKIGGGRLDVALPLKNVLLGCSVEDQFNADSRRDFIEVLAQDDGWATWVSYEPALGDVDWAGWEFIKWLVSGGESGANARPSHPYWHMRARDFCGKKASPIFSSSGAGGSPGKKTSKCESQGIRWSPTELLLVPRITPCSCIRAASKILPHCLTAKHGSSFQSFDEP